jgi:hypothetical protein
MRLLHSSKLLVLSLAGAGLVTLGATWAANEPARRDRAKNDVEGPSKTVLAASAQANETDNPKVAPGKVNWHPSFAEACQAAKKSGKPVMLFQLLGKLDHQFC